MNYQEGKIYAIRSHLTEKFYLGSTATTLARRLAGHKNKNKTTCKIIIDFGDAYIELLELFPCNSKLELLNREGQLQRLLKNDIVNKKIEGQTRQEYYKDNCDSILKQTKNYYRANVKEIKLQKQNYYQANAKEINSKEKQYRLANSEKIKLRKKNYYQANAEKIKLRNKQRYQAKKALQKTTTNI
jgi:hypothetical protein